MDSEMRSDTNQMTIKDTQHVIVRSKYFQNCAAKKSKRFRSAFTTEQIAHLEREFKKFPYIGSANRKEVANRLKIPERAVKIWFQNRRMKEKKEVTYKEFEMEDLTKDTPTFTNEPLNNARNWQSNNGSSCCPTEQLKINQNNFLKKLIIQTTTKTTKLNEKPCLPKKPIRKPKRTVQASANNSTLIATNKTHVPIPAAYKKVTNDFRVAPVDISQHKNACSVSSKNQTKDRANYCPIMKSYTSINQDMPQDLSSRSNLYSQQPHHCPVNSIPGFVPLHNMHNSYPPSLPPGNVIWKPFNMTPALTALPTSSVSMSIPHDSGVRLVNRNIKSSCSCSCNCNASLLQSFDQVNTRPHPQYIIAIPYSNPPK